MTQPSVRSVVILVLLSCHPSTAAVTVTEDRRTTCSTTGQVPTSNRDLEVEIHDPGDPGPDVHPVSAEVFFSRWPPASVSGPEYSQIGPNQLKRSFYSARCRITDPASVRRLWDAYRAARSSRIVFDLNCPADPTATDARIMVAFSSSDHADRWVAAGLICRGRLLMTTDDYRLHEKDGALLRELADIVGARAEIEAADPDIWR